MTDLFLQTRQILHNIFLTRGIYFDALCIFILSSIKSNTFDILNFYWSEEYA